MYSNVQVFFAEKNYW